MSAPDLSMARHRPGALASGLVLVLVLVAALAAVAGTARPAQAGVGFVPDEFSVSPLGSHWQVVRPLGVGSAEVSGGRLALSVPAGASHDPWTSNDAVRAVQPVADGDLSLQAGFDSMPSAGYQMQGLTVEQASDSFLRFEVHHTGSQLRLFASTTGSGTPKTRVSSALPALTTVHLRVARSGGTWTLSWSGDGNSWTVATSFAHPLSVTRVGPFVGNYRGAGTAPAFTALVDYAVDTSDTEPPEPPEPPVDTTPPQIQDVTVVPSDTTAQVSWGTDEPTTGRVEYGPTSGYGSWSAVTPRSTGHRVTLAGLSPGSTYHFRVVATDPAENVTTTGDRTFTTASANQGPVIDVWYGPHQSFGPPVRGQEWVNVLGNVSDPDGVGSLTYRLNGGSPRHLSIGPDRRRLQWPGDFNVDIPYADLAAGDNAVTLVAVDGGGRETVRTVTVQRRSGAGAGLPFQLDWDTGATVAEQAQVVDGAWSVTGGGLRTDITGYDRLVTVGDVGWSDYELTVPITVHELGPAAYTHLSGAPLIGVGMRWNGHTRVDSAQPAWGWYPTGAFAWYRFYEGGGKFVLSGDGGSPAKYTRPAFAIGTTYQLTVRATTLSGGVTRYQVKLWPAGGSEPAGWLSSIDVTGGPQSGSIVLVAHQLDGSFGAVTVQPV
ncbi:MAG: hypothetical protein GEV12_08720 [Micromonosporaceae bacterium]|nr:hypothetical protein [Micromonosporaceae bacterium]